MTIKRFLLTWLRAVIGFPPKLNWCATHDVFRYMRETGYPGNDRAARRLKRRQAEIAED